MMDSDEDDIYPDHDESNGQKHQGEVKMEDADDGEEEGEEVEEEEDDDDDVDFIIDVKDEPKPEPGSGPGSQTKRLPGLGPAGADVRKSSSTPTPAMKAGTPADVRGGSQPPNDRPGTDYPARHTSKIDPNGNPVHPATGKPIMSTDFDVDFPSESSKPWRKPGADITDYFNYGFDEFTWASYCLKQEQMPKEVKEITQQAEQMKAFVEGIPGGGMPGVPAMPGAPAADMSQMAMPNDAQMQQMFAAMTSQGLDPTTMDPAQFMQFMAGGGAAMMGQPQPPTGPSASFAGGGGGGFDQGGGGGGGGFGGRGRGKGGRRNW
ncbi:uncharacterized protein PV07_00950 [Cladophialophora immunda]|uniref:Pre-mRNA polyadenylation factor Fip1 domain-containing protein n=1 Tax=Cladophialophora immunda TaxID=569365 RepID=A0A0D2DEN4_9EURO|nr:uncharacterized protein PV07_00950 [Cladophialophora immunda]KIW34154.1 hypothetical protein PV07_00950 [Cladophialophora immunda]OQV05034.1 hypothetical protein CLAIMM_09834 [Cladophialophora immunda]